MLGSVSEAEDVVQEGFLRLHQAREGGERIESSRADMSTWSPGSRSTTFARRGSGARAAWAMAALRPDRGDHRHERAEPRQLATWARRHLEERRPRCEASREQREELATRFFAAAGKGDLQGLEELLAQDVVLRGDGGGEALALRRAVQGRARVARTLIASLRARARFGITLRRVEVNGQSGALFLARQSKLISVMSLDVATSRSKA